MNSDGGKLLLYGADGHHRIRILLAGDIFFSFPYLQLYRDLAIRAFEMEGACKIVFERPLRISGE